MYSNNMHDKSLASANGHLSLGNKPSAAQGSCGPSTTTLPMSLIELILAHVPHVSRQPDPTYLFALMALPPSVVPLAFQSILCAANKPTSSEQRTSDDNDDGSIMITDPWLCVSRLARPRPEFQRMLDLALPVLTWTASRAQVLHTKGEMVDRFITGLCKCGNVAGLEKCAAASLIAKSPQVLSEYLAAASESGLVEVLDWWFRELDQFSTLMTTWTWTTCLHECVRMACRSGRVHAVDWWAKYLQSQGRDLDRIIDRLSPCWLEMFSLGHVELLTHVHLTLRCEVAVNENEDGFHDDVCFMDVASAMGQTASLDWIMTYAIAPHYTTEAMDRASAAGYVHVLDWWARCGMPLKFTPAAKTDAAKAGQQAVVEWWNTFPLYRILLCGPLLPNNPTTAAHTTDEVTLASFGCLDWMRKLAKCEDGFITIYKARAFCQAIARFGHVHIMREYGMVLDCRDDLHDESIVTAAKFNQLAMWRYLVKVMYDLYEEEDPNLSDLWLQCTLAAAEHDSVDVFDMLLINLKTRPSPCSFPDVVLGACKGGAVRILQYLIDNRHWKPSLISAAQQQGALQAAIAGGHVHVLDWWHRTAAERSLAPDVKSSESWLDSLVALACVHGHANVLEWIGNTFGWSALTISSADVRAVGINKSKKVIAWLMAAHAKSNIKLSPASVKYLELASQSQ